MANKYIRHGAAFNGDGTTSAVAASNGAAGAWNTLAYFEGTVPAYGALAAGDVVYIRSKDESGADVTRTASAAHLTLGLAGLTAGTSAPVVWILDNGTIWSGIDGILKYQRTGAYTFFIPAANIIKCDTVDALKFECNHSDSNNVFLVTFTSGGAELINAKIDASIITTYNQSGPRLVSFSGGAVGSNALVNCAVLTGHRVYSGMFSGNDYSKAIIINPRFYMAAVLGVPWFVLGSYGSRIAVYGGSISGPGATTGAVVMAYAGTAAMLEMYGFTYPKTMTLCANPSGGGNDLSILGMGMDEGIGAIRVQRFGICDSRSVNNYPTLNATFPDSVGTGWSWYVYPCNASSQHPMEITFAKVYAEAAAAKVVTLEMLVGEDFTGIDDTNVWLDVLYIDNATGAQKLASSRVYGTGAALASSTASWSAATWGAVTCVKRKIAITTPTSIKQNTMVICTLRGHKKSDSATKVLFVDPDPQFSAP